MTRDNKKEKKPNEANSRPATPTNDDCCGNSCNPCVFDVHKKLLEQWEKRKIRGVRKNNFLSPLSYKIFVVNEIVEIGKEFVKIRLDCSKQIDGDSRVFLNPGQHVILSTSNKKSRPYTPISWTSDSLDFLIKVYPNGVFSNHLKSLKIADEIRVRGPYGDFEYEKNSFREIVAFCIGSGIAAIYPIARSIVNDETDETRIHLVAGFHTATRILLREELKKLSDYWNVNCTLKISNPELGEIFPSGMEIQRGRMNENTFDEILEHRTPEKTLILICGTREFNESLESWIKDRGFLNYYVFS